MGLEFFKSKPSVEKSAEQKEEDRKNKLALGGAAVAAAVLGGVAYDVSQEKDIPGHPSLVGAEISAPANNPTFGMKSTDAPKPVSFPADAAPKASVVDLEEGQVVVHPAEAHVVVNLTEKNTVIKHPEL